MSRSLDERLEKVWQVLMLIGEDALARDVAEAKHTLRVQAAQLRGEPQVITRVADDHVKTGDG